MRRREHGKIYYLFCANQKKKCDDGETITHKLKFIDSFRFMPVSLSDLVDNLSEISKIDCIVYKEKKNLYLNLLVLKTIN